MFIDIYKTINTEKTINNLRSMMNLNKEEYTIDRFEGNICVLENRKTKEFININKDELPEGLKEGDYLEKINGKYIKNEFKNQEIQKRIEEKMNNLWD